MNQFRQFWIKDFVVFKTHEKYADGASVREAYDKPAPNRKIHVIEYSALEAAQKEIAELQKENEEIKIKMSGVAGATVGSISKEYISKIENLTAALKVAEDAFEHIIEVQKFLGSSSVLQQDCEEALSKIQKIKKGLG